MAQKTFGELWNEFLLYAPGTPVPLAQRFVRNAYDRALNLHQWSELIKDAEKVTATEYSTGTVALTAGSASIVGTGTTWTAAMTNRQIAITSLDGQPYYTFTFLTTTTGTLDRVYQGTTNAAATYTIGEYYVEFPSDLTTLDDIRDLNNNWRLRRQFHQQNYIDFINADRSSTGNPTFYVSAPPRISAGVSYPRYEFYPKIPASTHLVFRYEAHSELTSNSDYMITLLESQAVIYGALADLCVWPGTTERPNPFFNLDLHKKYSDMAEASIHDSEMDDLERAQRMLMYPDGEGFPYDASYMQARGIVPQ